MVKAFKERGAFNKMAQLTADERFRVLRVDRTRDQLRAHFENYLSKYPEARTLRLISDEEVVVTLAVHAGAIRWI